LFTNNGTASVTDMRDGDGILCETKMLIEIGSDCPEVLASGAELAVTIVVVGQTGHDVFCAGRAVALVELACRDAVATDEVDVDAADDVEVNRDIGLVVARLGPRVVVDGLVVDREASCCCCGGGGGGPAEGPRVLMASAVLEADPRLPKNQEPLPEPPASSEEVGKAPVSGTANKTVTQYFPRAKLDPQPVFVPLPSM